MSSSISEEQHRAVGCLPRWTCKRRRERQKARKRSLGGDRKRRAARLSPPLSLNGNGPWTGPVAGGPDQACYPGDPALRTSNTHSHRIILSNLNKHKHTIGWDGGGAALGFRAHCRAYLAVSDLLSAPECGVTAGERRRRLETCLHLCIFHINKFLHRCIQTSLSALLHTTHSCHKHSDTQSTTREGSGKGKRKRETKKKKGVEVRGGGGKMRMKSGESSVSGGGGTRWKAEDQLWEWERKEREVVVGPGDRRGQESGGLKTVNTTKGGNIGSTCSFAHRRTQNVQKAISVILCSLTNPPGQLGSDFGNGKNKG